MKTWILPVDFTDTAKKAAEYAVQFAEQTADVKLIVYHVFPTIAAGSDGTPLDIPDQTRKEVAETAMVNLISAFSPKIPVEILAEQGDSLTDFVARLVKRTGAELVIMGLTDLTPVEQALVATSALSVAEQAVCPVLIVPPEASYKSINRVLFATDMKNVVQSTPAVALQSILTTFNAQLFVVNVDAENAVELSEEYKTERAALEGMLTGFNPQFHFLKIDNFVDGIEGFVNEKNIDIIITIPRKHSFFSALFNPSHTRKLVHHTHIPVVAIHE